MANDETHDAAMLEGDEFLGGCRVVIGVTGGIAAYKVCELVRLCVRAGAEVRVVMTRSACEFVTPLTFETLSHHPVVTAMFGGDSDTPDGAAIRTQHIELARWAEVLFVAPATANIMAKATHGIADDFLSTLILATNAPIAFAPAMNSTMWNAQVTQRNAVILREFGHTVLPTGRGQMAEPEVGDGRLLEPAELFDHLLRLLPKRGPLAGRRVIVTGGPTPEPIDPVRVITNRSSGKMGVALAEVAAALGAEVMFIHGPLTVPLPAGADSVSVETADEMHRAVVERLPNADALIMAAAVADYRPRERAEQKIKKHAGNLSIDLVPTTDILSDVATRKDRQVIVGFAMETDSAKADEHVRDRIARKDLDLVALNMIGEPGAGFGVDTNRITLYHRNGAREALPLMGKRAAAKRICEALARMIDERAEKA